MTPSPSCPSSTSPSTRGDEGGLTPYTTTSMDSISLFSLLSAPRPPVLRAPRDPTDPAIRDLTAPFCFNLAETNPMPISDMLGHALELCQEDIDDLSDDNGDEVNGLFSSNSRASRIPRQGYQGGSVPPYRHHHTNHEQQRWPMGQ